jgi:hypothetical protein
MILYHFFGRDRGYDIKSSKKGYVQCLIFSNSRLLWLAFYYMSNASKMLRDELTLKWMNRKLLFGFGYPRACRFRKPKQINQFNSNLDVVHFSKKKNSKNSKNFNWFFNKFRKISKKIERNNDNCF